MNPAQTNYICILKSGHLPNFKGMLSGLYQHLQILGTATRKLKLKKLNTESSKENSTKVNENNNMVRNYG